MKQGSSIALLVSLALILSGCGGGGDGGSVQMPPTQTPEPTPPENLKLSDVQALDPGQVLDIAQQAAISMPKFGSVVQSASATLADVNTAAVEFDRGQMAVTVTRQDGSSLTLDSRMDAVETAGGFWHGYHHRGWALLRVSGNSATIAAISGEWSPHDYGDWIAGGVWLHFTGNLWRTPIRTLLHITFPAYKARLDALVLVRARERGLPARQAKPCGQDARAPRKGVAIHKHPLGTTICHLGGDEIGKLNRVRILSVTGAEIGAFVDGPEFDGSPTFPSLGIATYNGVAAGFFAARYGNEYAGTILPPGTVGIGAYEGDLRLTADFGAGSISGKVDSIEISGIYETPRGALLELSGPSVNEIHLSATGFTDGRFIGGVTVTSRTQDL